MNIHSHYSYYEDLRRSPLAARRSPLAARR
jgi:hypothetical protein